MIGLLNEILAGAKIMLMCVSIVALVVLMAMAIDLGAGLYKAHLRGDARRSEALKRTGYKFCLYQGTIFIACGIDLLIHISKLYLWFGWELVYNLPLVTIVVGIFWCIVEFLSVREKSDQKTHSDIAKAEKMAIAILKIIEAAKKGETPDIEDIEKLGGNISNDKSTEI